MIVSWNKQPRKASKDHLGGASLEQNTGNPISGHRGRERQQRQGAGFI